MNPNFEIKESDIHPHIQARMQERGISIKEIEETLNRGWDADDAQGGTFGKTFIFTYNSEWEGKIFEQKEVTVYYKYRAEKFVLLSAKARYGKGFLRKEQR